MKFRGLLMSLGLDSLFLGCIILNDDNSKQRQIDID